MLPRVQRARSSSPLFLSRTGPPCLVRLEETCRFSQEFQVYQTHGDAISSPDQLVVQPPDRHRRASEQDLCCCQANDGRLEATIYGDGVGHGDNEDARGQVTKDDEARLHVHNAALPDGDARRGEGCGSRDEWPGSGVQDVAATGQYAQL